MSSQPVTRLTPEQYLRIERAAEFRSEYVDGEVFAMAGGSPNHAFIAASVIAALRTQLRERPCSVAGSDLRISCESGAMMTYPDIVVCCKPLKFHDRERDTLTDATLIVEVLSRSTRNYDRGEKFRLYRTLPSFAEYLLLDQYAIRAEHYVRQPDGSWLFREAGGAQAVVELRSIASELRLGDIYEGIEFEGA